MTTQGIRPIVTFMSIAETRNVTTSMDTTTHRMVGTVKRSPLWLRSLSLRRSEAWSALRCG